jgi:hypothetical protein
VKSQLVERHGDLQGSLAEFLEVEKLWGCPNYSEESPRPPCRWKDGTCLHCGNEQIVPDPWRPTGKCPDTCG